MIPSFRSFLGVAALVATTATAALAQDGTLRIDNVGAGLRGTYSGSGTYYISPFGATLTPVGGSAQAITIFCIDFLNQGNVGQSWAVNISSLLDAPSILRDTRHGDEANAVDRYKATAWLASQMNTASTTDKIAIQAAIWEMMTPGSPNGGSGESTWYNRAVAAHMGNWSGMSFAGWSVLTQVGADHIDRGVEINGYVKSTHGRQEYITYHPPTVVPEPATLVLFGSGFAGLVGIVRLRRRHG
jgi:hypothetical protein